MSLPNFLESLGSRQSPIFTKDRGPKRPNYGDPEYDPDDLTPLLEAQERESADLLGKLNKATALAFMRLHHLGQTRPGGSSLINHTETVGLYANRLAQVYYADQGEVYKRYLCRAAECAGYLHEAMATGASFESVVQYSDYVVARTVSALTPDIRVPTGIRRFHLINRIGKGDPMVHLITFADLMSEVLWLKKLVILEPTTYRDMAKDMVYYARKLANKPKGVLTHVIKCKNLKPRLKKLIVTLRELEELAKS